MLIGLTVAEPSATVVSAFRPGVWSGNPVVFLPDSGGMPMALAMSTIFSGPSSMATVRSV